MAAASSHSTSPSSSSSSSSLSYISSDELEEGARILACPVAGGSRYAGDDDHDNDNDRSRARTVVSPVSTSINEVRLPERTNRRYKADQNRVHGAAVGGGYDDDGDGDGDGDGDAGAGAGAASRTTSPVRPRSRSPGLGPKSRSPSSASISSDSSGEISETLVASHVRNGTDDVYDGLSYDQVTQCEWEGCDDRDCGDMDELVRHIDRKHIDAGKQKKWICRWRGCARGGHTHASGSALKAHMRRHTKEKPFMCILPECDRTFTRHDALMKHMRTVHRGEALRAFESPQQQQMQGHYRLPRVRLTLGQGQQRGPGPEDEEEDAADENPPQRPDNAASADFDRSRHNDDYNPEASQIAELGFDPGETDIPAEALCRLLRRQVHWAEKDREDLERRGSVIQRMRKESWLEKELILRDVFLMEERLRNSSSKRRAEEILHD